MQLIKRAAAAIGIGFVGVLLARQLDVNLQTPMVIQEPLIPDGTYLPDERNNIEVFQRVAPSVVHISSIAIQRDFFSFDTYEIPQGTGTGFVWDNQGHIVTNLHVLEQADRVMVRTIDQKDYPARLIGADPHKDLAILKIEVPSSALTPIVPIDDNSPILVGQKAIAIGNPFGLDHTLTVGVVSALGREITALSGLKIFGAIQTDAAINPGNSGGPLLNAQGRLIGVNTQIMSKSGSNAGIGFAIPAEVVKYVVPQLIKYGKVQRVGLGVTLLEDHFARRLGVNQGVVIHKVDRSSAADKVGLVGIRVGANGRAILGDIIVGVDGRGVNNRLDLLNLLINYRLGDQVELTLNRNGRTSTLRCELQALNE
jgi:S1-C subfamily serine protease